MLYKSNLKIQEGKAQAIKILKKGLDSYEVSDKWIKILINAIEDLDPTKPKNKYLELFSKFFIKHFDGDYLVHLARAEEDDMDTSLINKVIVKSMTSFNSQLQDDKITDKINSIEKRNLPINLSKIKDYKDFIKQLDSISSTLTKSSKKRGIQGLKLGKDYLQIPTPNKLDTETMILVPLNYKASKIIASDYVGQCEGKWCTAYQKTDEYWESYIEENEGVLVYIVRGASSYIPDNELKMAIYFYNDFKASEGFDANDKPVQPRSIIYYKEIEVYVKAHEDMIREALAKNFKQVDPNQILQDGIMGGILTKVVNAVELGADVNKPFEELDKITPLMLVLHRYDKKFLSEFDIKKMLTLLTDHGADWNKVNGDYAPIFYYFQLFRNDVRMIGFLETLIIKINWNIMSEGEYNRYPQEIFIQGGYQSMLPLILPILINMGMDIDKPLSKGESIRDFIKKYNLEDKFDLKEVYKSKFKRKSDVI